MRLTTIGLASNKPSKWWSSVLLPFKSPPNKKAPPKRQGIGTGGERILRPSQPISRPVKRFPEGHVLYPPPDRIAPIQLKQKVIVWTRATLFGSTLVGIPLIYASYISSLIPRSYPCLVARLEELILGDQIRNRAL